MPDAKSPAGPGKSTTERREAATEAEEIDELLSPDDDDAVADPTRAPRNAERGAHVNGGNRGSVPKGGR